MGKTESRVSRASDLWPRGFDELPAHLLQQLGNEEFVELRRWIVDRARATTGESHARELGRRLTLRRAPSRHFPISADYLAYTKPRGSAVLEALCPRRQVLWVPATKRHETRPIDLRAFSFIDDPTNTLQRLAEFARAECVSIGAKINFEDHEILDVGPYLVLGLVAQDVFPFATGGNMRPQVQAVLEATGLRRTMKMGKFDWARLAYLVSPFRIRSRRGAGTSSARDNLALMPTTKEKVATDLVETINEWLNKMSPPRQLTIEGRSDLLGNVSEILDNGERHSHQTGDGDWSIAGFMVQREFGGDGRTARQTVLACYLSIVSVGMSIAESLATADPSTLSGLHSYTSKHRGVGVSPETLATVYALQDGISRLPQARSRGGVGMMDMAGFTAGLGGPARNWMPPEIAIWSGKSWIRFSEPYSSGQPSMADPRRRLQFFNLSNSIDLPPDQSHVFDVPQRFPGTVISLRFALPAEESESK